MDRADVQSLIKNYNINCGRAAHIQIQTAELSARLSLLQSRLVYDETGPGAQNITGMPHGTAISDPTAEVAVRLASGYETDEMKSIRAKITALNDEFEALRIKIAYVDAWVKGLNIYERWLILRQSIDETHWRDLEESYKKEFGYYVSSRHLQRMRNAALEKIYTIAV